MSVDTTDLQGPPDESAQTDQEVIWSTQEAHWHCTPQGIRLLEYQDVDDPEGHPLIQSYKEGHFEPEAVQVSLRNQQGEPIEVSSHWDGFQLYLDVEPTEEPTMALLDAIRAAWRWHVQKHGAIILVLLVGLLLALSAVAIWLLFSSVL